MNLNQFKTAKANEVNPMESGDLQKRINKYIESAISIHFASISHNINQRLEQIENNIKADSREHKELKELLQSISGEFNKFAGLYYKDRQARIETRDKLLQNNKDRRNDSSTESGKPDSENVQVEFKELGTDINNVGDYSGLLKGFNSTTQLTNYHLYEIYNLIAANKPDDIAGLKSLIKPYLSTIGKLKAKEMGIKVFHYVAGLLHNEFFDTLMENYPKFNPPKNSIPVKDEKGKVDTKLIKAQDALQISIDAFAKEFKVPANGNGSISQLLNECSGIELTSNNELPEEVQNYILDNFQSGQLRKFGIKRQVEFMDFIARKVAAEK